MTKGKSGQLQVAKVLDYRTGYLGETGCWAVCDLIRILEAQN